MSYINDVMLVGELTADPVVTGKEARFQIKTGRPFKRGGKVEWDFVFHDVICYKDPAFNMLKTIAKKGKWLKVSGELATDKGKPVILIRKNLGDLGLMFDVLNTHVTDETPQEAEAPQIKKEPGKQEEDDPFMSSFNSGFTNKTKKPVDDDDIPF